MASFQAWKITLMEPFGWPIVFFMGWRMGKRRGWGLWEGKKGVIKTRTGIIPRIQSFIDTA
jgi:hypothetical protein